MRRWLKNLRTLITLIICYIHTAPVTGAEFNSKHFKVEKLSDGVYAVIHKFGGYAICNSGIIDLGDKVLIFDTFLSIEAAQDLKQAVKHYIGKPLTYVINSHDHNDHIRGNQVFSDDAIIISTDDIRQGIERNEPEQIQYEKEHAPGYLANMKKTFEKEQDQEKRKEMEMWIGYYEGMIRSHSELQTTLPELTFNKELTIYGSLRKAELKSFATAHTSNDLVLFLPEDDILFSGDLVFNGMHPYLPDGNPKQLSKALQNLQGLKCKYIVPGHGEVGGAELISNMINYIKMLEKLAMDIKTEKGSVENISAKDIPEPYSSWNFPHFFKMNMDFMIKRGN
jgi:glyoxylase-like metal-dependent hydrolase (beta-lactamase superfamily II)